MVDPIRSIHHSPSCLSRNHRQLLSSSLLSASNALPALVDLFVGLAKAGAAQTQASAGPGPVGFFFCSWEEWELSCLRALLSPKSRRRKAGVAGVEWLLRCLQGLCDDLLAQGRSGSPANAAVAAAAVATAAGEGEALALLGRLLPTAQQGDRAALLAVGEIGRRLDLSGRKEGQQALQIIQSKMQQQVCVRGHNCPLHLVCLALFFLSAA